MRDQVGGLAVFGLARCHRPAGDKQRGDIQPHGGHEHAGHDFVAIGDTDHPVKAVGPDHGLDGVGDDLAGGQRILHAGVAHGDAVADGDGVELEGHAAGVADGLFDHLGHLVQVHMAGHDLAEAVGDGDKGLVDVRLGSGRRPAAGRDAAPAEILF